MFTSFSFQYMKRCCIFHPLLGAARGEGRRLQPGRAGSKHRDSAAGGGGERQEGGEGLSVLRPGSTDRSRPQPGKDAGKAAKNPSRRVSFISLGEDRRRR